MSLVSRDPKTGAIGAAQKKKELESLMVPMAMMMLLAMIVLASASPMLGAIADDKTQRVFEMLLGSVTPFELMLGKVLASVAVALTSSIFYVGVGLFVLQGLALTGLAPLSLIPWFLVYLVADVMVLSALGMALGAACGSPHDAQQLAVVLLAPVLIPLFVFLPVLQKPDGTMALLLTLFPPFTPSSDDASPGHAGRRSVLAALGRTGRCADLDGRGLVGGSADLPGGDPDARQAAEVPPTRAVGDQRMRAACSKCRPPARSRSAA